MSRYISARHAKLVPYTPGEQPRDKKLIKLNTNESPYPPSPGVHSVLSGEIASHLNLYSDPGGADLRSALAQYHGVGADNVTLGNGSDESLAFAFLAFGDKNRPFAFPDITYGLYNIVAELYGIPYEEMPLRSDFTVNTGDYMDIGKNIVIANPNAPTGIALPLSDIECIAASNPDHVVIIDEAYADFWGQTAIPLTEKFDNLLVVRTYSKSRCMAGARLGYAIGSAGLVADMEMIRYSFNPYNINSLTLAAGAAALRENEYYERCWAQITWTREMVKDRLRELGLEVTDSAANFLFVRYAGMAGPELYARLRENGLLVRNLNHKRVRDWLRISIGTPEQMEELIAKLGEMIRGDGRR